MGVGWNNLEKIGKIIYVDVLFGKVISEMVLFIDLGLFDMCLDWVLWSLLLFDGW